MLITGLGVFLAGSVAGTLAGDVSTVIAARAVMSVGAALVTPLAPSVPPTLFGPQEHTKARRHHLRRLRVFNTIAAILVTFILPGLLFVLPPCPQAVLGHDAWAPACGCCR